MSVDHTKNIIEADRVSYAYGDTEVLKDVSLTIHHGDYLGLIGPNGSGKTTLLRVMLGLLKPTSGMVRLFGQSLEKFRDWWKIGYVPQKAVHFDPLFPATVTEVVAMGRFGKRGLGRWLTAEDDAIIQRSIQQVDMAPFRDRLIGDLSGGQQQRVFIARALAAEPEVIFLDEPTVGVDVNAQEQFYALLNTVNQTLGVTLVLVSHDIDIIAKEVTEIACLNQTLIYHGEPAAFFQESHLQDLYGKNFRFIDHHH